MNIKRRSKAKARAPRTLAGVASELVKLRTRVSAELAELRMRLDEDISSRMRSIEVSDQYIRNRVRELGEQCAMKLEAPKVARVHELEHRLDVLQLEFANRVTDLQSQYENTPAFSARVQALAEFMLKDREAAAKRAEREAERQALELRTKDPKVAATITKHLREQKRRPRAKR
jgi:Zn-dependent oligopeptidase